MDYFKNETEQWAFIDKLEDIGIYDFENGCSKYYGKTLRNHRVLVAKKKRGRKRKRGANNQFIGGRKKRRRRRRRRRRKQSGLNFVRELY